MRKWLWLLGLFVLAALPARAQMTQVTALVQDANGERYVNCQWSVVFVGQNTQPGAGPYQPAALLVGQQGNCDSTGNLRVSLADNVSTIRPTPSQWNFSICSAPGYIPGDTYCRSNMLVTITGQAQDLTSFFKPLMPLLPVGGGGFGTTVTVNGTAAIPNQLNFTNTLLPPAGSAVVNFLLNGTTVGAYVPAGGGGGGGSLTVNGGTGGSDLNDRLPTFPPNGINISWQAANGHISGAIVGDGIATHCFLGTGVFALCPGGGGGGSATLPTTPLYDLFASTGAGAAQASGILGNSGFVRAQVYTATGDVTSASPGFQLFPNASVEYFPTGYSNSQGNFGAINGLALYMSHSGHNSATGNGGIALGGGNSSGTGNQIYVDCEVAGCDFKVPLTVNGAGVGGGGGGGLPTIPAPNLFASNGSGSAVDSGVLAQSGFLRGYVLEATGTGNSSPFSLPNGSIEYFPTGGYGIGGPNGLALHFSHSGISNGTSPGWGNGGIALGGGNASGVNYQIYLDCESAPLGCDFKVPVTINGAAIGGGGGGGVTSINTVAGAFTFTGAGVSCATTTCTFSGGGGSLPTIPVNHVFASTGAGAAQDSNVLAAPNVGGTGLGVVKSGASIVGGMIGGTSPFSGSNGSQEWYGGGGVIGGVTVPNGAVLIMGNSASTAGAPGNGGVVLGGNSATTTSSKEVYLDCEHVGCDFKVPVTYLGAGIGGGGGNAGASIQMVTTPVCAQDNSQAAAPVTLSIPNVNAQIGETVIVAVASQAANVTFLASDDLGNPLTSYINGSANAATVNLFVSRVSLLRAIPSVTVVRNSGTQKFGACAVRYTGVSGFGNSGTAGFNAVATITQSLTVAAGSTLFSSITINGASTFNAMTSGTLIASQQSTAGTPFTQGVCNNTAGAAGTVSCVYNLAATGNGVGYMMELVPGGVGKNGSGTPGQLAMYDTPTTIIGSNGFYSLGANLPSIPSGAGGIFVGPSGVPFFSTGASTTWSRLNTLITAGGTTLAPGFSAFNLSNTIPAAPQYGRSINFGTSGNNIGAWLPGDGSLNCLSGQGTYVACGTAGGGGVSGATSGGGLLLTGQTLGLDNTACTSGQVMEWNGLVWQCATVGGGTINGATSGGGLTATGTTLGLETCTQNQYLAWVSGTWTCTNAPTAGITGATGGGGLVASGGTLGLITSGCTNGQVMQYNGSTWSCQTIPTGGGSGTVSSGTATYFTWYPTTGTTVASNPNLFDNGTLITSLETLAAPGLNVTGSGGISMTGTGATLPAPVANSGGIGIGPGNVPEYYSNGGAWTAIGSGGAASGVSSINGATGAFTFSGAGVSCATTTCTFTGGGGSGTVGTGTVGQFALYNGTNSVAGTPNLTNDGTSTTTALPISFFPVGPGGTAPTPIAGRTTLSTATNGGLIVSTLGGPFYILRPIAINGAQAGLNVGGIPFFNFNNTAPAAPANGINVTWAQSSSGQASAALVGDGSTNCLSGQGTYVPCSGGTSSTVTCMPSADLLTFTARTNVCVLVFPAGAKQWIVECNLIWNMQTGGSGATTITSRLNLSATPTSMSYWTTETWAGGGPTFGNFNVLAMAGDQTNPLNITATNNTDLTIWSYVYHGTLMVPAAGMTATLSLQSSAGTGAIRLGSFCRAQ